MPHSSNPASGHARDNFLRRVVHTVRTKTAHTKRTVTEKVYACCRVAKVATDYTFAVATGERARGFLWRMVTRQSKYRLAVDIVNAVEDEVRRLFEALCQYVDERGPESCFFEFLGAGLEYVKENWPVTENDRRHTIALVRNAILTLNRTTGYVLPYGETATVLVYLYSAIKANDEAKAKAIMKELGVRIGIVEANAAFPAGSYLKTACVRSGSVHDLFKVIVGYLTSPKGRTDVQNVLQWLLSIIQRLVPRVASGAAIPPAADGEDE